MSAPLTPEQQKVINNESIKYAATWINSIASATMVAGVVTPIVALAYGFGATTRAEWLLIVTATLFFLFGLGLHGIVQLLLRRLR